jgi:hypothetical protein
MKNHGWNDYEKAADKGPVSFGIKVIVGLFILTAVAGGLSYVFGWFGETAQVAQEQFGPRAVLQKYEQFKDQAAQLDAKMASIEVYEKGLKATEAQMVDGAGKALPKAQWPRDEREAYNQRATEIAGLKASFNKLAADYNANMAKFNYAFANQGTLPQGADKPLPREYKPYIID